MCNQEKTKHQEIDAFIEIFNNYKSERQKQKQRGLNEFNIFTTLLKKEDEVRLHSRFLAFLLNPNADHGQDELFLKLFLFECGEQDFFGDLKRCSVYCEHEHIDIYITDGNKHIIIENKIYAGDQEKQIKRYIEIIQEKDKNLEERLLVVYLSLDRNQPGECSLSGNDGVNGFYVENASLIGTGTSYGTYKFINLNYNKEIQQWLEKSHREIANITNLSVGITQYKDVIDKLYGTYKEKIMCLSQYLNGKTNRVELVRTIKRIHESYPTFRTDEIKKFLRLSFSSLKKTIDNLDGWEFTVTEAGTTTQETGLQKNAEEILFKIRESETSKVGFVFTCGSYDFRWAYFGICNIDNTTVNFENLQKHDPIQSMLKAIENSPCTDEDWLRWKYYYEGDLFDKIAKDGDQSVENFVNFFMDFFCTYKNVVIECNKILENPNQTTPG